MGAVQSDLKANIVQAAAGGKIIPPRNDEFWQTFWARPETAEHIFETITATDIRGMRDDATGFENLKTLVIRTVLELIRTRHHSTSLTEENTRSGIVLLNCIRILTRVLPLVYEADESRRWEESTFSRFYDSDFYEGYLPEAPTFMFPDQTITEQLVDTLLDLLFYTGFTLPWPDIDTSPRRSGQISYGLWQSGIACDTSVVSTREMESRRTEIMRLLLTLESKSIYVAPGEYIEYEVQALQCITRHPDKRRVQSLLCSLLNTIIKYHPDSRLSFDPRKAQGDATRETHVKVCLHFLLVNLLNRAPWDESGKEKNDFRLQLSFLHKPKHFQFLADGMFKILRRPLEASANVLSMSQRSVAWTPEMIVLQWELLFSNRKYLHYVIESGRALDMMVLLVYYAKESQLEGIGRICIFCLQTMSAQLRFGELLNRPFEAHDALPASIQVKNFHGKYSDFFVVSLLSLTETSTVDNSFWLVSLTTILRNVAPGLVGLARATSAKLVQTTARLAKADVLLAHEGNATALASLLDTINTLIELHKPGHENETILYAVWRARKRFQDLRELSLMDEDTLSTLEVPASGRSSTETTPGRDETEKARGKRPSEYKSSSAEFMGKLADLPLHSTLALISFLEGEQHSVTSESVPGTPGSVPGTPLPDSTRTSLERGGADVLRSIRELGQVPNLEHHIIAPEGFRFYPSIAALYASYYWGLVVFHDAQRATGQGVGIWAGTEIKLFRIKAGHMQGPSLWSPKGAVDAVGESIVAGVMDLTKRAKKGISGE